MGAMSQLLAKHSVQVRRGRVDIHRDQEIDWTLAKCLFGHQYAQEMRLPSCERSTEWVKELPAVVVALNGKVTRQTGKKPSEAIKAILLRRSIQKPSSTVPGRSVGLKEQKLLSGVGVGYLYQPGELEVIADGPLARCGPSMYTGLVGVTKPGEPVLYYSEDGLLRGWRTSGGSLRHSATTGWGPQALRTVVPGFWLHSSHVR